MSRKPKTFTIDEDSLRTFQIMCDQLRVPYSVMVNELMDFSVMKNNETNIIEFLNQEKIKE